VRIFVVPFILFAMSAEANICYSTQSLSHQNKFEIQITNYKGIDLNDLHHEIRDRYNHVSLILSPYLQKPQGLKIDLITREGTNFRDRFLGQSPQYLPLENTVRIPVRHFTKNGELEIEVSPEALHAMQIHEIVHAWFDANSSSVKVLEKIKELRAGIAKKKPSQRADFLKSHLSAEQFAKQAEIFPLPNTHEIFELRKSLALDKMEPFLKPEEKQEKINQLYHLYQQAREQSLKLEAYLRESLGPDRYLEYRRILAEEVKQSNEVDAYKRLHDEILENVTPYDELFSDLVATFMVEKKEAINEGIEQRHYTPDRLIRDFSPQQAFPADAGGPLSIKLDIKRAQTGDTASTLTSPTRWGLNPFYLEHNVLDGVRGYLWTRYWNGSTGLSKGAFLAKVLKAIHFEMDAIYLNPELKYLSPLDRNVRLIQEVERQLRA
jgi:hypothetical protein